MDEMELVKVHVESEIDQVITSSEYVNMADDERLMLISRGVRSSLRSRRITTHNGLYSDNTNCVGALLQLQSIARLRGVEKEIYPVHVRRLPWQHKDAAYSIHIAGVVPTARDGIFRYLDPTPSAGYLYGQTSVVNGADRIDDSNIQEYSIIEALTPLEYNAIIRSYQFEGGEVFHDEADSLLDDLSTVPAYRVRLAVKLLQKTGIKKYQDVIMRTAPESLRGSYRQYIDGDSLRLYEAFRRRDAEVRLEMGRIIAGLTVSEQDDIKRAHWHSTLSELNNMVNQAGVLLHPLDTLNSTRPVFEYERNALIQNPGGMTSNSYFFMTEGIG